MFVVVYSCGVPTSSQSLSQGREMRCSRRMSVAWKLRLERSHSGTQGNAHTLGEPIELTTEWKSHPAPPISVHKNCSFANCTLNCWCSIISFLVNVVRFCYLFRTMYSRIIVACGSARSLAVLSLRREKVVSRLHTSHIVLSLQLS